MYSAYAPPMPDVKIELIRSGEGPLIYVIYDAQAAQAAALRMHTDCAVAAIVPPDWNRSLSPWPAKSCFKGGEDFSGGADEFMRAFLQAIPAFEAEYFSDVKARAICGYSLAGLCAVYAMYKAEIFTACASVSGSMWFDGWTEYMEENAGRFSGKFAYFSVGDREKKTRNTRLACVEEKTVRAGEILRENGVETVFELNPGNHFNEPDARIARAMDRMAAAISKM